MFLHFVQSFATIAVLIFVSRKSPEFPAYIILLANAMHYNAYKSLSAVNNTDKSRFLIQKISLTTVSQNTS